MIARSSDWISARVDDRMVMMHVDRGHCIELDAVGARIWELLETPQDEDALCSALTAEFEVTLPECRAAVATFLLQLRDHGAIVTDVAPNRRVQEIPAGSKDS